MLTAENRDSMARPIIIDGRTARPGVARDAVSRTKAIGRPSHASPAEPELRR